MKRMMLLMMTGFAIFLLLAKPINAQTDFSILLDNVDQIYSSYVVDIDLDNDFDYVVLTNVQNVTSIKIYKNSDNIYEPYLLQVQYPNNQISRIHVADINGDSYPDILLINVDYINLDYYLEYYQNDHSGLFAFHSRTELYDVNDQIQTTGIYTANLDEDVENEIIIQNAASPAYVIDYVDGLSSAFSIATLGHGPLEFYDIDGDFDLDIISANGNSIYITKNLGGLSFGSNSIFTTYIASIGDFIITDLDHDSNIDFILIESHYDAPPNILHYEYIQNNMVYQSSATQYMRFYQIEKAQIDNDQTEEWVLRSQTGIYVFDPDTISFEKLSSNYLSNYVSLEHLFVTYSSTENTKFFIRDSDHDGIDEMFITTNNKLIKKSFSREYYPANYMENNNLSLYNMDTTHYGLKNQGSIFDLFEGLMSQSHIQSSVYRGVFADFNDDKHTDYLIPSNNSHFLYLAYNNQIGSFMTPVVIDLADSGLPETYFSNEYSAIITPIDFNQDGYMDILIQKTDTYILLNNQSNDFNMTVHLSGLDYRFEDFNQDGYIDYALLLLNNYDLEIYYNDGSGSVFTRTLFDLGTQNLLRMPEVFKIGDFNGDQIMDYVSHNSINNYFTIHLGNGLGYTTENIQIKIRNVHIIDFNNDGKDDILYNTDNNSALSVYYGHLLGTNYYYGTQLIHYANLISIEDMDGDGLKDILFTYNTYAYEVLLNKTDEGLGFYHDPSYKFLNYYGMKRGDINGDGYIDYHSIQNYQGILSMVTYVFNPSLELFAFDYKNISKTGYTFDGWFEDMDKTLPFDFTAPVMQSSMIYAKLTPIQYQLSLYDNYVLKDTISVGYSTQLNTVILPDSVQKVGYTVNLSTSYTYMPAQNISGNLQYTPKYYSITYYGMNDTVLKVNNYAFGSYISFTPPTNTYVNNYTFKNWNITSLPSTMPAENLVVRAVYEPQAFNILYTLNGGTNSLNNPLTYHIETETITLEEPVRVGYTFLGWFNNVNLTGNPVTNIVLGSTGNKNLYAKWAVNQYSISFNSNGGSSVADLTQDYNTSVTAPTNPTKEGYTFNGWYLDEDLSIVYVFDKISDENITLHAKWSVSIYDILYTLDGGTNSVNNPLTYHYETETITLEEPVRVGYTFLGWFNNVNLTGNPVTNIVLGSTGNKNLYAKWTVNEYAITFNTNGGSAVESITQNYNTAITVPANPTRVGYTFNGWSQAVPANMPAENVTLTASWTINTYTITFNTNGGSAVDPITQDYDTAITVPANPTRVGYTFNGWSQAVPANMPAENVTLTAQWTINQYTITFNSNGGSAVDSITQDYDTAVTAPAEPTRVGYTFNGWSQSVPSNMPADNIMIEAYWLKETTQIDDTLNIEVEGLLESIPAEMIENKEIEVILIVEILNDGEANPEDIQMIHEMMKRNESIRTINIKIILKSQGESDVLVTELTRPIKITITIPEVDRGYQNYRVIRIHNGVLEIMETEHNEAEHTLTFETDRFSTYAIIYDTSSGTWAWWLLLLLLIPFGYLGYRYHPVLLGYLNKKEKEDN